MDVWTEGMRNEATSYVLWTLDDGVGLAFELMPYGQFSTLNPVITVCTNLISTAKGEVGVNRSMSRDGTEHYNFTVVA